MKWFVRNGKKTAERKQKIAKDFDQKKGTNKYKIVKRKENKADCSKFFNFIFYLMFS